MARDIELFYHSEELIARDIEEFEKQKVHMRTKFKVKLRKKRIENICKIILF